MLVVQKYGGMSLETPEKILQIARRIQGLKKEGADVVVVVSAMGKTTDQLLSLAHQISPLPLPRELDMLLTAGERISMALLSLALNDVGVPAISLTGSQSGIITTDDHNHASVRKLRPVRVAEALSRGRVVLVAGFQGVSESKEVTTLGRGGSDTTAICLAAHFRAARCEILKDVRGVYTADPRVVPEAKLLSRCSLQFLARLSGLGAKLIHHRAAALALKYQVPVWLGHSVEKDQGTEVVPMTESEVNEAPFVLGVTGKKDGVTLLRCRFSKREQELWRTAEKLRRARGLPEPLFSHVSVGGDAIQAAQVYSDVSPERLKEWFSVTALKDQLELQPVSLVGVTGSDLSRVDGFSERLREALVQASVEPLELFFHPSEAVLIVEPIVFETTCQLIHHEFQKE